MGVRSGMTAAGGKTVPRRPRGADWLGRIEGVIAQARSRAVAAVNISMVCAYHEIGRIIVEEEQAGHARSGYGEKLLSRLSARLTERFGKGWSVENLKLMRRFYLVYRNRVNTVYPIPGDGARLVPVPGTKTAGDGEGGAAETEMQGRRGMNAGGRADRMAGGGRKARERGFHGVGNRVPWCGKVGETCFHGVEVFPKVASMAWKNGTIRLPWRGKTANSGSMAWKAGRGVGLWRGEGAAWA